MGSAGFKESCYAVVSLERAAEILAIPNERPQVSGFIVLWLRV